MKYILSFPSFPAQSKIENLKTKNLRKNASVNAAIGSDSIKLMRLGPTNGILDD